MVKFSDNAKTNVMTVCIIVACIIGALNSEIWAGKSGVWTYAYGCLITTIIVRTIVKIAIKSLEKCSIVEWQHGLAGGAGFGILAGATSAFAMNFMFFIFTRGSFSAALGLGFVSSIVGAFIGAIVGLIAGIIIVSYLNSTVEYIPKGEEEKNEP